MKRQRHAGSSAGRVPVRKVRKLPLANTEVMATRSRKHSAKRRTVSELDAARLGARGASSLVFGKATTAQRSYF